MQIDAHENAGAGTPANSQVSCYLARIPVEIIEVILAFVVRPKDILSFALASRACHNTALPLVYQHVDWIVGPMHTKHREAALRGVAFLDAHPDILAATRYLRVSEKKFSRGGDTKLFLDFSGSESPIQPPKRRRGFPFLVSSFPQTFRATNTVLRILSRFSGLVELSLRSITLPRTFYQSLHTLSDFQLRRLTIRHCRLSTRYPASYDPATLQLTELSIFSVHHARLKQLRALLKLARCPTLCILRLDRTLEHALGSLVAHGLPPSVHSLELDWRSTIQQQRAACELLFFFLNSCKFVRHLELTDMGKLDSFDPYPVNRRLKSSALSSLTSIAVPVPYLEILLAGRPIDSVTITDTTLRETGSMTPMLKFLTVDEISEVLKILQRTSVSLHSLRFNLRRWDKELFYMLARRQRNLRELHVAYQYGEIDDAFYMTLGNLIEFPHLERLHLYRFGDNMAGSEDERFIDQKEYMIIWQLYMPHLCEVALSPDVIWARSPTVLHGHKAKLSWSRYAVEPMDGVEGLIVIPCPKEARKYEAVGRDRRNYRQFNALPNVQWTQWPHGVTHQVHHAPQEFVLDDPMNFEDDAGFH